MPITIEQLKKIINVDIENVEVEDLNDFSIVFIAPDESKTGVNDAGNYEIIKSTLCGDQIVSYFIFVADGSKSSTINYKQLKKTINEIEDESEEVYFLSKLKSLPPIIEEVIKPVEGARLEIIRFESVQKTGKETSKGVLILSEDSMPCSSSSSSGSSSSSS